METTTLQANGFLDTITKNENGEHLIFDNEENYIANIGDFTAYEDVEIDETTLGQYTGLKDKKWCRDLLWR